MEMKEPKMEFVSIDLDESVIHTSDICEDESGGGTTCSTSRQNSEAICGTPQWANGQD